MAALVAVQTAIAVALISMDAERGAALALSVSAGVAALVSSVAVRVWLTRRFVLLRAGAPALIGAGVGAVSLWTLGDAGLPAELLSVVAAILAMGVAVLILPLSPSATGRHRWTAAPLRD